MSSSSTDAEEEVEEEEDDSSEDDEDDDDDYFEDEEEDDDDTEEEEWKYVKSRKFDKGKRKKEKEEPLGIVEEGEVHDRIVGLLKKGEDLSTLKIEECRAYLRTLKLRVTGTKAICLQRIREHWRIKDGMGEKYYPLSSFVINCTGDICKDDVILFKQRVFEKFDIVSRSARIVGRRTLAARVVKESYGVAKQQHTFTVEILWSKGEKELPALFPLLVKGRNLYRMKTFRQPWNDEAERLKVLTEKHKRGAAARHLRAMVKARHTNKGLKRQKGSSSTSPVKRQRKMPKLNTIPSRQVAQHHPK